MKSRKSLIIKLSFIPLMSVCSLFALPEGGQVVDGSAHIPIPTTTIMNINQTSDRAVLNWNSFNINAGEIVNFVQPNSSSLAINRVNAANGPSNILGTLNANGQVFILNSAGVLFGPGSQVNVAGILASTSDLNMNKYLQNGLIELIPNSTAGSVVGGIGIVNQGNINVNDFGFAAFVAPNVVNQGLINAKLGHVQLSSGEHFTVDFMGDNLINFVVPQEIINPALSEYKVDQRGQIFADGGTIVLSAAQANQIVSNVINMDGLMQADSVGTSNGKIILNANDHGFIEFKSGSETYAASGHVKASAMGIKLAQNSLIDASSTQDNTKGGSVYIGGNLDGELISPSEFNAKTVIMEPGATILANAKTSGDGGTVVLWSDEYTAVDGKIHAKPGTDSGDPGLIQTAAGNGNLAIGATADIDNGARSTVPDPGTGSGTTTPPPAPPSGNNDKLDSLPPSTANQITNSNSGVNHATDSQESQSSDTTLSSDVDDHVTTIKNDGEASSDGYPENVFSTQGGNLDIQPFEFNPGESPGE